jgi:hypothetical protein
MVIILISSSLLLVFAALDFQEELENLFPKGTVSESDVQEDGRWSLEIDLLFDTCDSRLDDWDWPDSLSEQDDVFQFPGVPNHILIHQGTGMNYPVQTMNRANPNRPILNHKYRIKDQLPMSTYLLLLHPLLLQFLEINFLIHFENLQQQKRAIWMKEIYQLLLAKTRDILQDLVGGR